MIPMSSVSMSMTTTVPAFIAKLWHMVSDPNSDDLICWTDDGLSFVIKDPVQFCLQLLPRYYKHKNMASFIRQLNKYGFHKVSSIESSSLRTDKEDYEYAHEFFVKDSVKSLEMIKRKMTTTSREVVDIQGDVAPLLQHLLLQVQELKDNHANVEANISSMKRENDALWREHSVLRQKYVKQQKMINQLIQFLVTLVQQTRGVNVNRSRGVPIILKDLQPTSLMAIEARKRDSPVISEIDASETIDPKVGSSTKCILKGEDPFVSPLPNYLIDSPSALDQTEPSSAMLFTAPDSPVTLEISASPTSLPEFSGTSNNMPTISRVYSLSSPLSPSNTRAQLSPKDNLTVCPQDISPTFINTTAANPSKKTGTGKVQNRVQNKVTSKKPFKHVPIVVKQENLDPPVSPTVMMPNIDDGPNTTVPELIDNLRPNYKRKEPDEASSSLVLSDVGSRHELENHLDVVQSDLDSLKDILQGLDTSAFMSLFNEQDPLGLNMPDSSNRQQLVSVNPSLIDMSDMLVDEDGDPFPASPIDMSAIDSLLNTPQPTPNLSVEPNFNPPKRFKK